MRGYSTIWTDTDDSGAHRRWEACILLANQFLELAAELFGENEILYSLTVNLLASRASSRACWSHLVHVFVFVVSPTRVAISAE